MNEMKKEMPKVSELTAEIFEEAEEMTHRAAIRMEEDNVQITADMTPLEMMQLMDKYYK